METVERRMEERDNWDPREIGRSPTKALSPPRKAFGTIIHRADFQRPAPIGAARDAGPVGSLATTRLCSLCWPTHRVFGCPPFPPMPVLAFKAARVAPTKAVKEKNDVRRRTGKKKTEEKKGNDSGGFVAMHPRKCTLLPSPVAITVAAQPTPSCPIRARGPLNLHNRRGG